MTPSLSESHRSFSAAIFDFDETIVNLEAQHNAAAEALCRELGSSYLAMPPEFRNSSGRRVVDEVAEMRRFFGWQRPTSDLYARRRDIFLEACRSAEIVPMAGAIDAVHSLRDRGLRLAIASSGIHESIDEILTRLGVRELFEAIVAGEQVERGKPDPETYLTAARMLAMRPSDCLVFEDSSVGVQGATAAGMYCVAIRNPDAHLWQDLSAANLEVGSFEEIDLDALLAQETL
jgi:HAD superfamily hydrolase (TIGR01509 family)